MLSTLTAANMPLNALRTQFSESTGSGNSNAQQPQLASPPLFNKERKNFGLQQVDIF